MYFYSVLGRFLLSIVLWKFLVGSKVSFEGRLERVLVWGYGLDWFKGGLVLFRVFVMISGWVLRVDLYVRR